MASIAACGTDNPFMLPRYATPAELQGAWSPTPFNLPHSRIRGFGADGSEVADIPARVSD